MGAGSGVGVGSGVGAMAAGVVVAGVLGASTESLLGSLADAEPHGGWDRYRLTVAMVTRTIIAALTHQAGPLRRLEDSLR